jgi:hypothetical protein
VGDAGTMSFGSTAQKQALLEEKNLDTQRLAHLAQLRETQRWHDINENLGQQKADVAQQRADVSRQQVQANARSKGLILGDDGSIKPMTPEQILADPILSQNYDLKRTAINVQNYRGALYEAQRAALTDPTNPMLQARLQKLQQEMAFHQDQIGIALARLQQGAQGLDLRSREAGLKQYQPALDAQRQLQTMRENYRDALNGDQQAMVSLLMNHVGMTLGAQKGAHLTRDSIREAERSRGLISGASSILNFDADGNLRWDDPVRAGITLTPEQMRQMLNLGEGMFRNKVSESRSGASYLGITAEPEWDLDPDSPIPSYTSSLPPTPIVHAAQKRNQGSGSSGTKVLSLGQIQQAARDHGVSVDEAKKQALAQGYQVK